MDHVPTRPRPLKVELRPVEARDLGAFFEYNSDPIAIHMAAFTSAEREDRVGFDNWWARLLAEPSILARAVLADDELVGNAMAYGSPLEREVTYWIARSHWGRGIATRALEQLIQLVVERPLHASVAKDNLGSRAVLEHCGFVIVGEGIGFAEGRGCDVEEYLLERL